MFMRQMAVTEFVSLTGPYSYRQPEWRPLILTRRRVVPGQEEAAAPLHRPDQGGPLRGGSRNRRHSGRGHRHL